MDVPRHVLRLLFTDTKFPLIQHHLDSYNDLLDTGIPTFLKVSNPFELERGDRFVRVYIGGKDGSKFKFESPTEEDGTAIVPHTCRLENRTYALTLRADIEIEYTFADKTTETKVFPDAVIGKIPLMLRSKLCYLSAMDGYEIGECKYELGGYFIIDGSEKVLLTQELLGNNMIYSGKRQRKPAAPGAKTLVEQTEAISFSGSGAGYKDDTEYFVGIRTMSEDGARGPNSHFLVIPPAVKYFTDIDPENGHEIFQGDERRRIAMIALSGFTNPVPVLSIFRALGVTTDRDLYNTVLASVPDKDRSRYDTLFQQLVISHDAMEGNELDRLANETRSKSKSEVVRNLHEKVFSHMEGDVGLFRRKAYMLGHMLKTAMDLALGQEPAINRDNMQYKRMKTSGVLMFEEFKRIYREIGKSMLLDMDSRLQFESKTYDGKNIVNLVQPENVGRFWKSYRMLNEFGRSFKGSWGGRVGVAQELARPSYAAALHQLRKTDLQIDKTTSTAPPRRLYASQFGILCPTDSPDGSDIGYKKALTVFARISTAFPADAIKKLMVQDVRSVADIHPTTWKPEWTRIYINTDLVGVCTGNTEELHRTLLTARRTGQLPYSVSLAWNRLNNEYKIYSDAGRPIRPVYREGVTPAQVLAAKSWEDVTKLIDYIDAAETDSLLLSMESFHPTRPSEIHMSFNLSALANLVPYSDHNPAPRNAFSIAQQKQAASWYHTNYKKRFDTNAMLISTPQKPISQTWIYNEVMGAGGCLPYGVNSIVAFTMYGGHNQEDSMILNASSLKRGMHNTMYYHSYDTTEEMIDPAAQIHTQIANPLKHGDVIRREGFNYDMLDEEGIIKPDSIVDKNTILVGMLTPTLNESGQITGFRDTSVEPKRGQTGRVDAVYKYATQDGLRGVKIRIVEERIPELGDKLGSRHSQKGTVGMIYAEEDMPFTADGLRPDLIFNPHGIPTRMTVGQFLEAGSNNLGIHLGSFIDATPFTVSNRMEDLKAALLANGFEPHNSKVLYNGFTGEMMEADVFVGPIYYQRLKQMVADKINYRDTGPRKPLTHQPVQGRDNEGGMRIGEMERDGLIAHGMSKFITESFMDRSDKATLEFNKEEGRLDTSRDTLQMPYAMALFTHELESMHLTVRLETD